MTPNILILPMSAVPMVKRGKGQNWSAAIVRLPVGGRIFFSDGTPEQAERIRQSCNYLQRTRGGKYRTQKASDLTGADMLVRRVK